MKKLVLLALMLTGVMSFELAQAAQTPNLQVVRNESDLYISWDPLSADDFEGQVGYAVNWGEYQGDVRIDKYAKQYLGNVTSLSIRGADFKRNDVYYFRVFSYGEDGREKPLKNGSKILKWKETTYGVYDTDLIEPNDPVIVPTTTGSNGNTVNYDFGSLGVLELDTFADVSWSAHTKMAQSDYDGFVIEIASDTNFTNILGTLKTERGKIRARILGLTPQKDYYVRGSFQKDGENFGTGEVKKFTTISPVPRDASTVASRNLLKIEKRSYLELDISDGTATTTSTTSSSSSSTTTTTTSSVTSSSSDDEIEDRIKEIERTISSLNAELVRLKAQLRKNTGNTTSSTTVRTSSSTASRLSIRERIAERLAQLRSRSQ